MCRDGMIEAVGPAGALLASVPPGTPIASYPGCLITPGFIDTHVHYVQIGMVALTASSCSTGSIVMRSRPSSNSPMRRTRRDGKNVLRRTVAQRHHHGAGVLRGLSAIGRCAVSEAEKRGMRLVAGKVLMDRNAPEALRDTPQKGYDDSKALIGALAQARSLALRDHAALRRHLDARAARRRRDALARTSGRDGPYPHRREQARGRMDRRTVSDGEELSRRLRPPWADRTPAVLAHGIHLGEDELCRCHESGQRWPLRPRTCSSARAFSASAT